MTRSESMKGHLIAQFYGKPVLAAIIESLGEELDEIISAFSDLRNKRWINTGDGVQLDGIGDIIGRPRQISDAVQIPFFGFVDQENALTFGDGRFRDASETWLQTVNLADAEYRMVLWQKVFKNNASGTLEDTIKSLLFIFSAPKVFVEDAGNAKIMIAIGRKLTKSEISLADAIDLMIRGGGVGVKQKEYFNYDNYFGFLGQPNSTGFGVGEMAVSF